MKAINIKWDVDTEDDVVLPSEIEIPGNLTDVDDITEYLSDVTGYCHFGYELADDSIGIKAEETEICDADFVSVWDGGIEVRSKCKVNTKIHEVFDIEISQENPDNFDVLERQYIEINGNEFPVFHKEELNETEQSLLFWYEG